MKEEEDEREMGERREALMGFKEREREKGGERERERGGAVYVCMCEREKSLTLS